MACLNRDILFDIGKQLIEDGDQEAVYRFGISGRQPLEALTLVFKSVKIAKLYSTHYSIGWDAKKLCHFDINSDKPHSKFLMNCIGEAVINVHLGFNDAMIYSSIISKLIDKKSVSTFSVNVSTDYVLAFQLLAAFSKTLKNIKIPYNFLGEKFIQLSMNLDSLTIMDNQMADVMIFSFAKLSLIITSDFWLWKQILIEKFIRVNPKVSNFTHLTFISKTDHSAIFADVNPVFLMRCFPSFKELQFNLELTAVKLKPDNHYCSDVFEEVLTKLWETFQNMPLMPSKMIYNLSGAEVPEFWFLDRYFNCLPRQPFSKEKFYFKKFSFNNSREIVFDIRVIKL